jgi:hypothetical protein
MLTHADLGIAKRPRVDGIVAAEHLFMDLTNGFLRLFATGRQTEGQVHA